METFVSFVKKLFMSSVNVGSGLGTLGITGEEIQDIPHESIKQLADLLNKFDLKWAEKLSAKMMKEDSKSNPRRVRNIVAGGIKHNTLKLLFVRKASELLAEYKQAQTEALAALDQVIAEA